VNRSPSRIAAALAAPDRLDRAQELADAMAELEARFGAATHAMLKARGFTEAELRAYEDRALEILSGRPTAGIPVLPEGRVEGLALVRQAREIRARTAAAERGA
jgi:hypothetical protein